MIAPPRLPPHPMSWPAARVPVGVRESEGCAGTGNNGPVSMQPGPANPMAAPVLDPSLAALLKRDAAGLVAAVIQQHDTGEVLMVGWMDDAALHATLTTRRTTFFSRSRQEYWVKGEASGHRQWVKEVRLDCDGDTLLVRVDQEGPACHTGARTCFDARVLLAPTDGGVERDR
jgi:phosphoribosyl-AMP cyclohydrolase